MRNLVRDVIETDLLLRPFMFSSFLLISICQQVNIPLSSLGEPLLMGVILNHTSAGRPSAEFYIRYTLI